MALVLPLALSAAAQEPADPAADPLDQFRARYEELRDEALEPIRLLKVSYVERLGDVVEAARAEGDLDGVKGALAEIDWVEGRGAMPTEDSLPEILDKRKLYLAALQERERQRADRLEAVALRSAETLEAMKRDYTRDGKLSRAEATVAFAAEIRDEVTRLKEALEVPSVAGLKPGEKILWSIQSEADFKTAMGCEASESGGSWTLTSPPEMRGHVRSPVSFSPPFRISALVSTDSGDLRFYYGAETSMEFLLFNWTRNPTTLRMGDPTEQQGIHSVPDQGLLDVGRTYLIEVAVEKRKIEVFVDGERRGTRSVDLSRHREPVGIGPFGTATLPARMTMEHFVVISE